MKMILIMILLHLVADYTLQGCLASLKQKKWWEDLMMKNSVPNSAKYKHDYIAGLACHSLYWSLLVYLPLCFHPAWSAIVITQAIIHGVVDDLKANRSKLNLIEDQLLHLLQIVLVWIICTELR